MKRYLTVIDNNGVYFRQILFVTHHGNTGEVTYDAKPIKHIPKLKDRKAMLRVFNQMTKKQVIDVALDFREGYFSLLELIKKQKKH